MLFYGPPGTGKTSTILALAHELFGPELMKSCVLELNASDEHGIQVIREKVKNFACATVTDSLTHDAQTALRHIMENYSRVTCFCLICNYVSCIIEPLTSCCAKFRFKPLDISSAKKQIEHICENENINYDPKAIDEILKISNGNLRKSIMFLQSAARLHQNERITADSILEIGGKACIGEVLGEIDKELCDGADDNFQPMKLLINFSEI
ncbi:5012_t:CDS:2, partial [Entrophospora sp. SA101]